MFPHPDPLIAHIHLFLKTHATPEAAAADESGVWKHILRLLPPPLSDSFNHAAGRDHAQPALKLQNTHGLRDIGTHYRMPYGLDVKIAEAYCMATNWLHRQNKLDAHTAHAQITALANRLIDLNPALARLQFDRNNQRHCTDIVMGVTSGFNTDDMQFFLDGNSYQKSMDNPAYAAKAAAALDALGADHLGWVPAPKTLDRILAQRPPKR